MMDASLIHMLRCIVMRVLPVKRSAVVRLGRYVLTRINDVQQLAS